MWGASEITSCGTEVSQLLRDLNSSLSQVQILVTICYVCQTVHFIDQYYN